MTRDTRQILEQGIHDLGLSLNEVSVYKLLDYLHFLFKWNQTYNITGHQSLDEMLSLHLLDSLAVIQPLKNYIEAQLPDPNETIQILDVGTGAGLPGIVIAICFPNIKVTCLDAVAKKTAFLQQLRIKLDLHNVTIANRRIESHSALYHIITSRAFSSLIQFVSLSKHCLLDSGCWFAMEGKFPTDELNELADKVEVFHVEQLTVPNINANRCLVYMRKRTS